MSQGGAGGEAGFWGLVAALRAFRAGPLDGDPSDRALARSAGVSPATIGQWLAGERFPQEEGKFLVLVRAVAARAAARGVVPGGGTAGLLDEDCWRQAYRAENERRAEVVSAGVERARASRALAGSPIGRPLEQVTDPFVLEVHRPVQPEDASLGLPLLPSYVPREHDQALGQVVRAAADGRSGIAVLVGGSSTGKTRACWEALALLRGQDPAWRLWHPIDPSRPDAALRELPGIGPRTVVWLNEAQFYLDAAEDGLGERVAAGLRELVRDPGRAPVLVLATMWPQFWDALTARPADGDDRRAQARELLAGHDITVPAAFTPAQMGQLSGAGDVRLVLAAQSARDGEVIQFLAGAPELLARYRHAPPAAAALIDAAMDARRLGMGEGLPQAFLEATAPGYLTDAEWDALGEDWLEQALAYAAVPCKGARGPLTHIRPRPARRASRSRGDQPVGMAATAGPLYRLADYLDQHGRAHRASQIPLAEFWSAAAAHAAPGDQAALGVAAHARGLYRYAAQLHKNAAAFGNPRAAASLVTSMHRLHPDDHRPADWAARYADPSSPDAATNLLSSLRLAGAGEQAMMLADRAAARADLSDPYDVSSLLNHLREVGANRQVSVLLSRNPAGHADLGHQYGVTRLLDSLRLAGAGEQAMMLADRAAARADLSDPYDVSSLLNHLREVGANRQVSVLLSRNPGGHADLSDPDGVARLMRNLRLAGAGEQAMMLADRAAQLADLSDPDGLAQLLDSLRAERADRQVSVLLGRDPGGHADLSDPDGVARLLDSLRAAGADRQVSVLLGRDPAGLADLSDPGGLVQLLDSLRLAGAGEQAMMLADRAAQLADLSDPDGLAQLLDSLRAERADRQVSVLLGRDPGGHADLSDPDGVARLLDSLRAAGAVAQTSTLADRAAQHASLRSLHTVISLLRSLRMAGTGQQVSTLLDRLPAAGMFSLFEEYNKAHFQFGREPDGKPAKLWGWDNLA